MKKLFFFFLFFLCFGRSFASDWESVYQEIAASYLFSVDIEKVAVAALKGLNKVDKNLHVGNDGSRLSLYYKGKVVKVLRKPEQQGDTASWGNLTEKMMEAAVSASPKASERDFEIEDMMAASLVEVLDPDSKYYRSFDDVDGLSKRNRRVFAAREEGGVLYVKILAFNKQTLADLKSALEEYKNFKAIVLDLRGCSGGMAQAAAQAADMFLSSGILLSTQGRLQSEETYYNASEETSVPQVPAFVLIDAKTASAAEIFALSLQEQGRAKLIGTQSKGKGTMQKLIGLSGGGVLALSTHFVRSPSGKSFNKKGVVPDVCTFEEGDDVPIPPLLERKNILCAKESREDSALEMKIVDFLLKQTPF